MSEETRFTRSAEAVEWTPWQRRLVDVLAGDLARPDAPEEEVVAAAARLEVLAFDLGDETYGIPIDRVAEILMPRPVTPLPRTPDFIRGVVSLRGTVLAVLDMGRRLGLPACGTPRTSRILVLRDGEEWVGFWVERVRGVVRFAPNEVQTTDFASAVDARLLDGIGYDRRGTLVAVLKPDALCDFRPEGP